MVNYCRVYGCHNRSDREKERQFYRLPEIISREGEKTLELSKERRRLWLSKLNQDFAGKNLKNIRECSDHFVTGKKAPLYSKDSPEWAPTVDMGHQNLPAAVMTPSPQIAKGRFQGRKARTDKTDAARTLLSFSEMEPEPLPMEINEETGVETQTDVTALVYNSMENELSHLYRHRTIK